MALIKSVLRSKEARKEIRRHLEGNRIHGEPVFATPAYVVRQVITAPEAGILLQASGEEPKTVSVDKDGPKEEPVSWEDLP